MNSSLRRTGAGAALALCLASGLAACGNDDSTTTAADSNMSHSPMASHSPMGGAHTFGSACSAIPKTGMGSLSGMAEDPVATAASHNPLLSTLVTAVTKAGLVDTLNGASGLTVFAPTNAAFAALPKKELASVLADKKLLTEVLTHHVVSGQLDPMHVTGSHTTLNKDAVEVAGDEMHGMTVSGAHVLCGNITTGNATVYVIDKVLLPKM
jgi:uncharacterized surface protein with fasciclin (FAS1) repeats